MAVENCLVGWFFCKLLTPRFSLNNQPKMAEQETKRTQHMVSEVIDGQGLPSLVTAAAQAPVVQRFPSTEVGLPEKASPGEKPAKLDKLGSRQKILTLQSVDS